MPPGCRRLARWLVVGGDAVARPQDRDPLALVVRDGLGHELVAVGRDRHRSLERRVADLPAVALRVRVLDAERVVARGDRDAVLVVERVVREVQRQAPPPVAPPDVPVGVGGRVDDGRDRPVVGAVVVGRVGTRARRGRRGAVRACDERGGAHERGEGAQVHRDLPVRWFAGLKP